MIGNNDIEEVETSRSVARRSREMINNIKGPGGKIAVATKWEPTRSWSLNVNRGA